MFILKQADFCLYFSILFKIIAIVCLGKIIIIHAFLDIKTGDVILIEILWISFIGKYIIKFIFFVK